MIIDVLGKYDDVEFRKTHFVEVSYIHIQTLPVIDLLHALILVYVVFLSLR